MEDVLNRIRINCGNLTPEEWVLLETLDGYGDSWVVPTPEEWAQVPGVLALVDIRRGYDCKTIDDYEFGYANIRINEHGVKALAERKEGRVYQHGKPTSQKDLDRIETKDNCWTTAQRRFFKEFAEVTEHLRNLKD
jgi:hypothetical protein